MEQLKIYLPTGLEVYLKHYSKRAKEGVITKKQAENLKNQLKLVKSHNKTAILDNKHKLLVDKGTYYEPNYQIAEDSDELIAFRVNESEGTQNTIKNATKLGKRVAIYRYSTNKDYEK